MQKGLLNQSFLCPMVLTTSDRANYPLVSPGQKPEQLVPSAPDPVAVSASSTLATTSLAIALALACLVMQVTVMMMMIVMMIMMMILLQVTGSSLPIPLLPLAILSLVPCDISSSLQ